MAHLFHYRFKCMIKNKELLFWSLAFPLILTTLFSMVLRGVYHTTPFSTISIVMVDTTYYTNDSTLQSTMKEVMLNEEPMFAIQVMDEEHAKQALDNKEITAYVIDGDTPQIYVTESDITTTVVTSFFEEYKQKVGMIQTLYEQGVTGEAIQQAFSNTNEYIVQQASVDSELDAVFFYTVLAMNCLFGGYWSIDSMHNIQANLSTRAARLAGAPIKKSLYLFVDFILCMLFELCFLMIMFVYMQNILNISFGKQLPQILLMLLVGALAGNATGTLLGVASSKNVNMKTGILTGLTLLCSFLSGMMVIQMKYLVDTNAPLLSRINPVNMITDGLYALYYFGMGERFLMNLLSLCVFIILGYGASFFMLRKRQYQSLEARS